MLAGSWAKTLRRDCCWLLAFYWHLAATVRWRRGSGPRSGERGWNPGYSRGDILHCVSVHIVAPPLQRSIIDSMGPASPNQVQWRAGWGPPYSKLNLTCSGQPVRTYPWFPIRATTSPLPHTVPPFGCPMAPCLAHFGSGGRLFQDTCRPHHRQRLVWTCGPRTQPQELRRVFYPQRRPLHLFWGQGKAISQESRSWARCKGAVV